jgi:arylsulfatase A-like enzyme
VTISRREFLLGVAAGAAGGLLAEPLLGESKAAAAGRPNVLLLISDQHRADAMGWNNPTYLTPNLDNLARGGVAFTNCFTTNPICSPARSSLMTGQYPHQTGVFTNGVPLRPDVQTIGEYYAAQGYQTSYFGKWHLGARPQDHGFRVVGNADSYYPLQNKIVMSPDIFNYINRYVSPTRPFFMVVSWLWPHPPRNFVVPDTAAFPADKIPIPENFYDDLSDKPAWYSSWLYPPPFDEGSYIYEGQVYRTQVRQLDRWVGQVFQALAARGMLSNTIIAYTADHGDSLGNHKLRHKMVAFDESIHIPLLLRVPGAKPARKVVDDLVSQASIPGTLIQASGGSVPAGFTSGSVYPSMFAPAPPADEAVFFEFYGVPYNYYRGVRTRTAKYVRQIDDRDELYDLALDPAEMVNRAEDPAYAGTLDALKTRLRDWWLGPAFP